MLDNARNTHGSCGFYEAAPMAFTTGTLRGRLVTVVAPCSHAISIQCRPPRHFHTIPRRAPGFHTRCLFFATPSPRVALSRRLRSGSDMTPKSFRLPSFTRISKWRWMNILIEYSRLEFRYYMEYIVIINSRRDFLEFYFQNLT